VLNGYCGDYEYGMENSVIYHPDFNYESSSAAQELRTSNVAALMLTTLTSFFYFSL
jgi:hypothetical protein